MVGKREMNTRAYLSSFNFKGTDQQKKVGDMSGGERNRLTLASLLQQNGYRTGLFGKWHLGLGFTAKPGQQVDTRFS